jgi:hypothetical protein
MAFVNHNPVTMGRVEFAPSTAKIRWRLEDGPTPPGTHVILITPERQSNANGQAL